MFNFPFPLHVSAIVAIVPIMAFLHRVRGGLFPSLPGKSTYWIWIVVGLALWGLGDSWPVALASAIGYLLFCLPGWMRVASQGHITPAYGMGRPLTWDEKIVEFLDFKNQNFGCFVRTAVFLIPYMIFMFDLGDWPLYYEHTAIWPVIVPIMMFWPSYAIGWKVNPTAPSNFAEWPVGAAIGAMFALSALT